jgi:hypothetical protein
VISYEFSILTTYLLSYHGNTETGAYICFPNEARRRKSLNELKMSRKRHSELQQGQWLSCLRLMNGFRADLFHCAGRLVRCCVKFWRRDSVLPLSKIREVNSAVNSYANCCPQPNLAHYSFLISFKLQDVDQAKRLGLLTTADRLASSCYRHTYRCC